MTIDSVRKHMRAVSADGVRLGTVDSVEGNRIKLATSRDSDGRCRFVSSAVVAEVEGDVVSLWASADAATKLDEDEASARFTKLDAGLDEAGRESFPGERPSRDLRRGGALTMRKARDGEVRSRE